MQTTFVPRWPLKYALSSVIFFQSLSKHDALLHRLNTINFPRQKKEKYSKHSNFGYLLHQIIASMNCLYLYISMQCVHTINIHKRFISYTQNFNTRLITSSGICIDKPICFWNFRINPNTKGLIYFINTFHDGKLNRRNST